MNKHWVRLSVVPSPALGASFSSWSCCSRGLDRIRCWALLQALSHSVFSALHEHFLVLFSRDCLIVGKGEGLVTDKVRCIACQSFIH